MRILISGICGFVGSTLAKSLLAAGHQVTGFDSYIRPGSETNRAPLEQLGAQVLTADLRDAAAMAALPAADDRSELSDFIAFDIRRSAQAAAVSECGETSHLPMQCREKIRSMMSVPSSTPVTSPSAATA